MTSENKKPELDEKDFIQNGMTKNPLPLYVWIFLGAVLLSLLLGLGNWYQHKYAGLVSRSPFLQVTNRELSLFLWQNPEFMRANVKDKANYLPGFNYIDSVTMDLASADQYVSAPPELLFRYHTWSRLLKEEFIETSISKTQFEKFLREVPEWHPRYWPAAPHAYIELTEHLDKVTSDDLTKLSKEQLPLEVRMAFQGWHNFFIDGEAINDLKPTIGKVESFISSHPHYARNYWRNIVMDHTPRYLEDLDSKTTKPEDIVPSEELTSFLRVAFFNYTQLLNEIK